jgi:hypothetical protein
MNRLELYFDTYHAKFCHKIITGWRSVPRVSMNGNGPLCNAILTQLN